MENLGFGLNITVVGMGLVFLLLAFLWLVLSVLGRLDQIVPERDKEEGAAPAPPPNVIVTAADGQAVDPGVLAAVAVAVLSHTAARRRQAAPAMRATWPGSQIYASRWLAAGRTRQTRGWQRR